MSKKLVYSMVLFVILMGVLGVSFNVNKVEAYPSIAIRADGSIYPSTANITSHDNVTYAFTADINASIVVHKDNIVVDGAGYTVQGGGDGTGIDLSGRSNVTIKNMKIKTFGTGIYLYRCSNNMISGNVITDNEGTGVSLYLSSNNNTVSANTITNNYRGVWVEVSTGISSNNVISGNNIEKNIDGIIIYRSLDNIISDNNVTENTDHSIYLDTSDGNRIYHNNFIRNGIPGFYFSTNIWDAGYPLGGNYWSDHVCTGNPSNGSQPYIIDENNIDHYPFQDPNGWLLPPAISIVSPENKTYTTDTVSLRFTIDEVTSWAGYSLDDQANVTVTGNTTLPFLSDGSHHMVVYANDTLGNVGSSGTVYFTIDTTVPSISIMFPSNKTYDTNDVQLIFTLDEPVSWIGYSLDGQANVTITENITLSGLSDGSHSLIVCANDTAGNMGLSDTVYFTIETREEEPFPKWIVVPVVIIAVVGVALLVYFTRVKKRTEKAK